MHLTNSETRYGLIGQALHWSMAALLVAGFISGQVAEDADEHDDDEYGDDHEQHASYESDEEALDAVPNALFADTPLGDGTPVADAVSAATVHAGLGLTVLGLLALRLLWRTTDTAPHLDQPTWEAKLARAGHIALYAVMAALPLTGLALALTASAPTPVTGLGWLGLDALQPVFASHTLHEAAEEIHEALVGALLFTVALHLAAVAYHALIRKDGVLKRMLP